MVDSARAAAGFRFAIVASRFNSNITDGLLKGALDALASSSIPRESVTIVRVPGAFEIPVAALKLAETGDYDAIICLGCLIKGDTMHFEYIAAAAAHGIMDASTITGVPLAFGVLTTLTEEQAMERAADGPDNKGREAASAALEMAALFKQFANGARV